jgi:hypothetical protein
MRRVCCAVLVAASLLLGACSTPTPEPPTPSIPVIDIPVIEPDEPQASPTATEIYTPRPSVSIKPKSQYCIDYIAILGGEADTSNDEAPLDFKEMSKWAKRTIDNYTAASKHAPSGLADDYAEVIKVLKQMKATSDAEDQQGLIDIVRRLPDLNDAMDAIQDTSEKMCS